MIKTSRKIIAMLSREQKLRLLVLLLVLLVSSIAQIFGVVSIAPFIALVANPSLIESNALLASAYAISGASTERDFIFVFASLLMAFIWFTNAIAAVTVWATAAFSMRVGREIQTSVLRGFLRRPYSEITQLSSSKLISIATNDANRFTYMVIQQAVTFIAHAIVVTLILIALIWFDPIVALVALTTLGGGYAAIFVALRAKMASTGHRAGRSYERRMRILQDSLGGAKEIKLAGTEALYEEELDKESKQGLSAQVIAQLISDLPRFALESMALCALLCLGLYLLMQGRHSHEVVSVLSLYGMAGYRLMPAAQNLFRSASLVQSNMDVTDRLLPAIRDGRRNSEPTQYYSTKRIDFGAPITFEHVSYRYPESDQYAVDNVSFSVPPGAITVLVGESGSGKSTIADLFLGLLQPTKGSIYVGGTNLTDLVGQWQKACAFVAQNIFLLDDTIERNIVFGLGGDVNPDKLHEAARLARVLQFAEPMKDGLRSRVGERGGALSGGERQRIGIARALYRDARVLVMDEATSALDTVTELQIISALDDLKRNRTILMVAHRLAMIRAADHILAFSKGRLVGAGSYADLMERCHEFRSLVHAANAGAAGYSDSQT